MAMGSGGSGSGLSADINVTPMIDVLLVLLIIFMITLPLSRRTFDAQVPPEQKQQPRQRQQSSDQIVLELKADGTYAINTLIVPFEQLVHQGGSQSQVRGNRQRHGHRERRGGAGDRLHALGTGCRTVAFTPTCVDGVGRGLKPCPAFLSSVSIQRAD